MFLRCLTRKTFLYTEMIALGAVLHGNRERFLGHDEVEHPLALQIGGSDPQDLALAARLAETWGYSEINLNCGCPSDPVQRGGFGAALMRTPGLVAECVRAMCDATSLPVTVKARIGIDGDSSDAFLDQFVGQVAEAGCRSFAIHARTAWLSGLSPKENRTVPPLDWDRVRRLKRMHPHLEVILNGGVLDLDQVRSLLEEGLDGVMVGRVAWDTPWIFASADVEMFGERENTCADRAEALDLHAPYIARALAEGQPFHRLTRSLTGLYRGHAGSRRWRRALAESSSLDEARKTFETETGTRARRAVCTEERPVRQSPLLPQSARTPASLPVTQAG